MFVNKFGVDGGDAARDEAVISMGCDKREKGECKSY